MRFEKEILQSRAGQIRIHPNKMLRYVIFENIAKYVGINETKLKLIEAQLVEIAKVFLRQPSEALRQQYIALYYQLAILGYIPNKAAHLPESQAPESVILIIERRNQVLSQIYAESFNIQEAILAQQGKKLTWEDMMSAEDLYQELNDERLTRLYGYNSREVFQLNQELYQLASAWSLTENMLFLYQYKATLYKLILLGFDPCEIDTLAEIPQMPELPSYYWQFKKL